MDIIFVKIRNDKNQLYDSYIDYWRLVNFSGFKTCEISEIDKNSDNIYIFSPCNGNVEEFIELKHTAKYIIWQLERPNLDKKSMYGITPNSYADETWVSDRALWKNINNKRCKFVVMGGDKKMGGIKRDKKYDFCHFCYSYGRREHIIVNLALKDGYKIAPATFQDREKYLSSSKYGLCVHQDKYPTIEPLRYTLFACWKLPLIVEKSEDYYPYKVIDLKNFKKGNTKEAKNNAKYNYNLLTKVLTFKNCVENEINRLVTEKENTNCC